MQMVPSRRGSRKFAPFFRPGTRLGLLWRVLSKARAMHDRSLPLIFATAAFLGVLLWRVRPSVSGKTRRASREALREARARIDSALDEKARALAICDAADLVARRIGGGVSAKGLYLRALRSDEYSVEVVARAVAGLSKRPRTLEGILWRHLAAVPWTGESGDAARAALDALRTLYDGPLKNAVRARALGHARDALAQPGGQNTAGSA
jgi:hypothetical protein